MMLDNAEEGVQSEHNRESDFCSAGAGALLNPENDSSAAIVDDNSSSPNEVCKLQSVDNVKENAEVITASEMKGVSSASSNENRKNIYMVRKTNDLHCPFVWKPDLHVKSYRDHDIERLTEFHREQKDTSGYLKFRRFVVHLVLCYHRFCQHKIKEAMKYYEELQIMLQDKKLRQDYFFSSIMDALTHIIRNCYIYLLKCTKKLEEATEVLNTITSYEEMDATNKAGIWGIRASIYAEYGYEGVVAAVRYINNAIELDQKNAHWYFLRGVYLGRVRRISMGNAVPLAEEIKSLEIAMSMKEDAAFLAFSAEVYQEMSDRISKMYSERYRQVKDKNVKLLYDKLDKVNKTALSLFKKSVKLDPTNTHLLFRCGKGLMRLPRPYQDLKTAQEFFKKGLSLAPKSSYGHHCVAKYYENYEHNNQLALKHLRIAVESMNYPARADLVRIEFLETRDKELLLTNLTSMLKMYDEAPIRCKILAEIVCYYLFIDYDLVEACFAMKRLLNQNSEFNEKANKYKSCLLPLCTDIPLFDILCNDIKTRLADESVIESEKVVLRKFISNLCFADTKAPDQSLAHLKARLTKDIERNFTTVKNHHDIGDKNRSQKVKKCKNEVLVEAEKKYEDDQYDHIRRFFNDLRNMQSTSRRDSSVEYRDNVEYVKKRSSKSQDQDDAYEKFQQFVLDVFNTGMKSKSLSRKGRSRRDSSSGSSESEEGIDRRNHRRKHQKWRSSSQSESSSEDDHRSSKNCEKGKRRSLVQSKRCYWDELDDKYFRRRKGDRKSSRLKNEKYSRQSKQHGSDTDSSSGALSMDESSIRNVDKKSKYRFGSSEDDSDGSGRKHDARSGSCASAKKGKSNRGNIEDRKNRERPVLSCVSQKDRSNKKSKKVKSSDDLSDRDSDARSFVRKSKIVHKSKHERSSKNGKDADVDSVHSRQSRKYEHKSDGMKGSRRGDTDDENDLVHVRSGRSSGRKHGGLDKKTKQRSGHGTNSDSSHSLEKNKAFKESSDDDSGDIESRKSSRARARNKETCKNRRSSSNEDDDLKSISSLASKKSVFGSQKSKNAHDSNDGDNGQHSRSMSTTSSYGKSKRSGYGKENIDRNTDDENFVYVKSGRSSGRRHEDPDEKKQRRSGHGTNSGFSHSLEKNKAVKESSDDDSSDIESRTSSRVRVRNKETCKDRRSLSNEDDDLKSLSSRVSKKSTAYGSQKSKNTRDLGDSDNGPHSRAMSTASSYSKSKRSGYGKENIGRDTDNEHELVHVKSGRSSGRRCEDLEEKKQQRSGHGTNSDSSLSLEKNKAVKESSDDDSSDLESQTSSRARERNKEKCKNRESSSSDDEDLKSISSHVSKKSARGSLKSKNTCDFYKGSNGRLSRAMSTASSYRKIKRSEPAEEKMGTPSSESSDVEDDELSVNSLRKNDSIKKSKKKRTDSYSEEDCKYKNNTSTRGAGKGRQNHFKGTVEREVNERHRNRNARSHKKSDESEHEKRPKRTPNTSKSNANGYAEERHVKRDKFGRKSYSMNKSDSDSSLES